MGLAAIVTITIVMTGTALLSQVVPTASLSGTVTDPAGAVVPSVRVELVNTATQVSKDVTADQQGRYQFNFLPPGRYDLSVSAPGFARYRQTGITLDVNAPATANVQLSVQSAQQESTVVANAQMVDTESGTLRQIVGEKYVQNLPLNGRNAATLVYMAPGTVPGKG